MQQRFMDMVIAGQVSPEMIDDYVAKWHRANTEEPIHEFLGMTAREYEKWLNNPLAIHRIIDERLC